MRRGCLLDRTKCFKKWADGSFGSRYYSVVEEEGIILSLGVDIRVGRDGGIFHSAESAKFHNLKWCHS